MRPTLTEVAGLAGVSVSTASRAFSDPDRLNDETLARILGAAAQLDYRGRARRGGDVASEPTTIGVIVPDIINPIFAEFVRAAQSHGWYRQQTMMLADTDSNPQREREILAAIKHRVDGLVVVSPRQNVHDLLRLADGMPLVLVNRESDDCHTIITDATDGLRQAIGYLARIGHRRFAYVQGPELSWTNQRRLATAIDTAEELRLQLEVLGWSAENIDGGEAAAASVAASGATAALVHNDPMAIGVMRGLRGLGLNVPRDVSVVGVDNTMLTQLTSPMLASVDIPMARAGVLAMDILFDAPDQPRHEVLTTQFMIGESTAPVRGWRPPQHDEKEIR
ncbi:MAG TPA: LacI family DNA-binding transcriptional regulator [Micropruina sp.]|nr:LacI family DNA-binding transcriptional regulator [Micropruina sp.]